MMKSSLKVAVPQNLSLLSGSGASINWKKCCLCQQNGSKTVCSARNSNVKNRNQGYESLAARLEELRPFNFVLPCGLPLEALDGGGGIAATFIENQASWHKACSLKFTQEKKFRTLLKSLEDSSSSQVTTTSGEDTGTSTERIFTRSSTVPVKMKDELCFICRSPASRKYPIHHCETDSVFIKVKEWVKTQKDSKLAGLLSDGDVFSQERKYHKKCLNTMYNKCRGDFEEEEENEEALMCEGLALADLLLYMRGKLNSLDRQCVFRMGELRKMYCLRLAQLMGVRSKEITETHSSRLREKVLEHFPQLTAKKSGREYILMQENASILPNIEYEDQDDDALALNRVARKIHKKLLETNVIFQGSFESKCEEDSIPPLLLATVNLLLYGSSTSSGCRATKAAVSICQLIIVNIKDSAPKGDVVRQKRTREPPLPLYVALSNYGHSRGKKRIVDMHRRGLSVSYNRVQEVSSQLCRLVVKRCADEGVLCPSNLLPSFFTVSALDNIDFASTSTTSKGEFHGTGISIFQLPLKFDVPLSRMFRTSFNDVAEGGVRKVPVLPDDYAFVADAFLPNKQPPCRGCSQEVASEMVAKSKIETYWRTEESWLQHVADALDAFTENDHPENISWAGFHSNRTQGNEHLKPAVNALLPLFHEKSASVAMIKHGMDIVGRITNFLNGNQQPVMCMDQPLYALAKTIQWTWPEKYGEDKFVTLFGAFHIEQSFLRVIGQLLQGSGWMEIYASAGIVTLGSAEAMLKVTHVTKARAAHQITAAVLHSLLKEAYDEDSPDRERLFGDWEQDNIKSSPTFKYWHMILNVEVLLLTFVRSIRESDYSLYKETLKLMMPWYFVTNHQNYSRWLSVHVQDLEELAEKSPWIHEQFSLGKFSVRKSPNPFSALAVDQAHEQNNALLKSSGGAVGLTQDASSLRRWTIGSPEIARLLEEFEGVDQSNEDSHHEVYESFQKNFLDSVRVLKEGFMRYDNPFKLRGSDLLALHSRVPSNKSSVSDLYKIDERGLQLYKDFVEERLHSKTKSIFAPIARTHIKMFVPETQSTSKPVTADLKADIHLFSRLFAVGLCRNLDLKMFFKHENQKWPPSLSINGSLRPGQKSSLVEILTKDISHPGNPDKCDAVVFDGAGLVHLVKPITSQGTFQRYYDSQLRPYIIRLTERMGATRVDVVWDLYSDTTIKDTAQEGRGAGVRRQQLPQKGLLPNDWPDYLRNSHNKMELFQFLAEKLLEGLGGSQVVTNVNEQILSTSTCSIQGVSCKHREEADGRIMLHVYDCVSSGATKILIRCNDTDVVVLAVSFACELQRRGLQELWVLFGTGTHQQFIPAHTIAGYLGEDKSVGLRGFHSFTGCDTTSFLAARGKKSAWRAWSNNFTVAFKALAQPDPLPPDEHTVALLEVYTAKLYGVKDCSSVDEARMQLFATEGKPLGLIPPTSAALRQHILRAAFQGGQIWGRALTEDIPPSPEGWGWNLLEGVWRPVWSSLSDIWAACRELDRCGCTAGCTSKKCTCVKNGLPCTIACKKCKGECQNSSSRNSEIGREESEDEPY